MSSSFINYWLELMSPKLYIRQYLGIWVAFVVHSQILCIYFLLLLFRKPIRLPFSGNEEDGEIKNSGTVSSDIQRKHTADPHSTAAGSTLPNAATDTVARTALPAAARNQQRTRTTSVFCGDIDRALSV
ncbi:Hypothetical predicted protein [Olea europaea subsp. europaea]|uniref:Uncharacterized protein n=1 Tax=Olea europaea subsp. europaea TaxID=158383 RepID=A0A8S0V6U0_OLEEU|nr:Hypothetical predicted protein [Olea europaea subsp. europaea]